MATVKLGKVGDYPANIFSSENVPGQGVVVFGRDADMPSKGTLLGPAGNRWYLIAFRPGADWNQLMPGGDSNSWHIAAVGNADASNGGTNGQHQPIYAHETDWLRQRLPELIGANVDNDGSVLVDSSKVAAIVAKLPNLSPTGPAAAFGSATTTSGLTGLQGLSGLASTTPAGPKVYELSVGADGDSWFPAKTPQESASHSAKNPHAGFSALLPDDVKALIPDGSGPPAEWLDVSDYVDQGWHGFPYLVAYQQDTHSAAPATDEVREAMDSAMAGDEDSQRVLTRLGIRPPAATGVQGFVGSLESRLFGRKSY